VALDAPHHSILLSVGPFDTGAHDVMSTDPLPFAAPGGKTELEEGTALTPRFGSDGLVTCVTTDADTSEVLMVAHMNAEALARTLESGEAWYWSRSRAELWHKGDTSGQVQTIVEMRVDCDQDALWLKVRVAGDGGCCHTGRRSCFYRVVDTPIPPRLTVVA
jgi:phosphoribosyl-AMP cyclohydrolase